MPETEPASAPAQKEQSADKEWLKTLYVETWKQYSHEDIIAQTRGTILTAIFAALIALLGVITVQVIKIPCATLLISRTFAPGIMLLGALWVITSVVLKPLILAFKEVTEAGHRYVNVRSASLRVIEAVAKLGPLGPATLEDLWRTQSNWKNPKETISILPGKLAKLTTIPAYNFKGGFSFLYRIVDALVRLDKFLRIAGILLLLGGASFPFLPWLNTIPLCQAPT